MVFWSLLLCVGICFYFCTEEYLRLCIEIVSNCIIRTAQAVQNIMFLSGTQKLMLLYILHQIDCFIIIIEIVFASNYMNTFLQYYEYFLAQLIAFQLQLQKVTHMDNLTWMNVEFRKTFSNIYCKRTHENLKKNTEKARHAQ